jgi:hypothetical protein
MALQRIAIPIIPGKFEIGKRSRFDVQNNVIFRIAPIHDPIRQKPGRMLHCDIQPRARLFHYHHSTRYSLLLLPSSPCGCGG